MFLVVYLEKYVEEHAVQAVEAVEGQAAVVDEETGEVTVAEVDSVEAVEGKPEVIGLRSIDKCGIERRAEVVAHNLANGFAAEYYKIDAKVGSVSLTPVTLSPVKESRPVDVVTIEAGGEVVGEAIV